MAGTKPGHDGPGDRANFKYDSAFSRRGQRPSFARNHSPMKIEGAGKAGCPLHPQPRVENKINHTSVVTTGSPKQSGLPCAMVYGLYRALPGDRALLPPSLSRIIPRKLDASVGAPGPHVFTVRQNAARLASPKRPPHPAPNVRDDRDTPLSRGRDERKVATDLGYWAMPHACDTVTRRAIFA